MFHACSGSIDRSRGVFRAFATALGIGLLLACGAARADDLAPLRSSSPPYFTADLAVSIDSTARARVSVTITVPYAELSWSRTANGYAAGAGFSVELQPDHGDRLYGDAWERRLQLASYEATVSSRNNLVVSRTIDAPPGGYRVHVRVRDVSSEFESEAVDHLVLLNVNAAPVGFADLELGVLDSSGTFQALPTRQFGYNSDLLASRTVLFDRRSGAWPRVYHLHWRVLDESDAPIVQGDTTFTLQRSADARVLRPGLSELFLGGYRLEVELVEGKQRWKTTRSFEVEESGPPRGKEFDQMLEALSYIADGSEIDGMRGKSADEQAALWERFWRRRDPTPDTPRNEFQIEFFRRLRYAAQHFTGFGPGWRSDMGRIYVRYGPPDQIEQRPATSSSPQLELWYYNQPYRRFVFGDREGFGHYTLLSPALE